MGLLEAPGAIVSGVLDPIGKLLQNPLKRKVKGRSPKHDFPEGFQIVEIVDGKELSNEKVILLGNMMPKQPFSFGGKQRIQKEFYPGHSEPTVQVFGPEESDMTVKGKLKDKRYKDPALAGVSTEIQEALDAIRVRGNLCRFSLGEWKRYGFLEETEFEMNTLREIEYTLKLNILGFNPPIGCKIVTKDRLVPVDINKKLIADALAFQKTYSAVPADMPQSIADFLNEQISDVAGIIGAVTGFVDKTLTAGENIVGSAQRAIGLIKNAKASLSRYNRRVGSIVTSVASLGAGLSSASKVTGSYNNLKFIQGSKKSANSMMSSLASLEKQFAALAKTVPQARYRVKTGDTLQKIAIQYYNDALQWKVIFDHNKLSSTSLTVGKVLEIPKL
jgi:LysM repeat protein